jgi:phosphotransferase system  glucose/maltose/N-acetylglucosamine-specific IIC component
VKTSVRTRYTAPLLAIAALFVLAGGFVHLREWLEVYRDVPAQAPGSAVVRLGFPLNAAVSALIAVALAACAVRRLRWAAPVVAAAALFQVASLAALVVTRTGSLFGWSEMGWGLGASQSRAVEIGALVALAGVALVAWQDRLGRRQRLVPVPAKHRP